jgi:ferrous iron transport protein A
MSVCDLKPGQRGVVTGVYATGAVRRRLLDMGLLRKTVVSVDRVAPFGDPVWLRLGGTQLALRRKEALTVMVDVFLESDVA